MVATLAESARDLLTREEIARMAALYDRPLSPDAVALIAVIRANPIWEEHQRRVVARGRAAFGAPVRSVMDVLGERLSFAATLARFGVTPVARAMLDAVPFLWLSAVRDAAAGLPLPKHSIASDLLPHALMWWTFEDALDLASGSSIEGLLLRHRGNAVEVLSIGEIDQGSELSLGVTASFLLRFGQIWPTDFEGVDGPLPDGTLAALVLSLLSFLNSPFIPKRTERLDGAFRRSSRRVGWSERDEDAVTFVDLRSVFREPAGTALAESSAAYRHRWVVRGHHRAQWYPSLSAHKVIWIAPHIKGPEDAPFASTTYRVKR